jgi:hypothetical protein
MERIVHKASGHQEARRWDIDSPSALAPEGVVVQFGQPPNRIDLLNAIDGVSFAEGPRIWTT